MALTYQTLSFFSGASGTVDVGTAGNNRLLVLHLGREGTSTVTDVTVDGKSATQQAQISNGNTKVDMWAIHEDQLGTSAGSVTVSLTGGSASYGVHVVRYHGAAQRDAATTYTGTASASATVSNTSVNASIGDAVVSAVGGSNSGIAISTWTSPLTERRDAADASSHRMGTAEAILASALSGATLTATFASSQPQSAMVTGVRAPASEGRTTTQLPLLGVG